MHLENFIQFTIRHNALIIEGLLGLIVLFVLILSYRTFLSARAAEKGGGGVALSGDLEETLKKLLEKAQAVPAAAAAAEGAGSAENAAPLLEEIAQLKKSLEAKQSEIEAAKAAGGSAASAQAGMNSADKAALEEQLKELQSKLAEYEIISEDIADLSFYKEENAKLQKELEGLKAGGGPKASLAVASASAAPPEPPVAAALPVEPVAAAPEPAAAVPEPPPPAPAPEPVMEADIAAFAAAPEPVATENPLAAAPPADFVIDDDIMKEFAAAVDEQKANLGEEKGSPIAAKMAANAAAAEVAPVAAPVEAAAGEASLGEMDMEKMVAEATGLDNVKVEGEANILESSMDPDKLAQEAASMEAASPGDAKLMGDFENFVQKKGGA